MPDYLRTGDETVQAQFLDPKIATGRSIGGVNLAEPVSSGSFQIDLLEGQAEPAADPLPDIVEGELEILVPARIMTLTEVTPPASNVWEFDLSITDALGDPIDESVSVLFEVYDNNGEIHPVSAARLTIRGGGEGTMVDNDRPRVVVVTNATGDANLQLADTLGGGIIAHVVVSLMSPDIAGNSVFQTVTF